MMFLSGMIRAIPLLAVAFTPLASAAAQVVTARPPSSEADIRAALSGGVSGGRWTEGLMFEGIEPQPWLRSASNWFPNTEEIQPEESRPTSSGLRR